MLLAGREERLAAQKFIDPQTDLYDRTGWSQLLTAEEERCKLYGNNACVIVSDDCLLSRGVCGMAKSPRWRRESFRIMPSSLGFVSENEHTWCRTQSSGLRLQARTQAPTFGRASQAYCGVVNNVCGDASAPRPAKSDPSAAPLSPPKPAIACTI